jgi:phosphoribosylformylglycinamidine synthase
VAKHLECGAVVAAAPAENIRRERPAPGDIVILLGGRTGRDGIGGATGSSKSHDSNSLSTMASEVQKGNAPEERKLQRLFRDSNVTRLIKRCNDFGAGGVAVAIGELADGLDIDLDAVRKKYDGLDGTELAISESQERMAVVVAPGDASAFIAYAEKENLEAYPVARVTESPRLVMRWRGQTVADLSRDFLGTNGAVKRTSLTVSSRKTAASSTPGDLRSMASSLPSASRRGLVERFDGTIGAGSVLMPFGGKRQRTPAQAMAALLPVLPGQHTRDGSLMAWGFDPEWMTADPYKGAYASVTVSLAKLVAAGGDYQRAYLSLQEYFEKLRDEPTRWGKPFQALLGALDAQMDFAAAAIGGKDSMSGSFLDLDVPPTLISFAVAPVKAEDVLSPEFKQPGHPVYRFASDDTKKAWEAFHDLAQSGKVDAAWAVERGAAEAVMNMSFGNGIGFTAVGNSDWYSPCPGAIIAELTEEIASPVAEKIGVTTLDAAITLGGETVSIDELLSLNEGVLEGVYPTEATAESPLETFSYKADTHPAPAIHTARPKALIPVFPGTNCEYDTARAMLDAGGEAEVLVIRNLTAAQVSDSAHRFAKALAGSQMLILPGGFSGGDEPDGSGKLITAFLRAPVVREQIEDLLERRDGLILGICNGFQALIKLGLVPYGKIIDTDAGCPTLTHNVIGRHQSSIVRTRVCSNRSPWLMEAEVGEVYSVPISHGEGRFIASEEVIRTLAENGQIATQYVDDSGRPSMDTAFNPNGSRYAIEAISSPDGRVLGKMGHSERIGKDLYRNVPGRYDMGLFRSGVKYFT